MELINNKIIVKESLKLGKWYAKLTKEYLLCGHIKYDLINSKFINFKDGDLLSFLISLIVEPEKYVEDVSILFVFLEKIINELNSINEIGTNTILYQLKSIDDLLPKLDKIFKSLVKITYPEKRNENKYSRKFNEKIFQYYNLTNKFYKFENKFYHLFFNVKVYDFLNSSYIYSYEEKDICIVKYTNSNNLKDSIILENFDERKTKLLISITKLYFCSDENFSKIEKIFDYIYLHKFINNTNEETIFNVLEFIMSRELINDLINTLDKIILKASIIPDFSFIECGEVMKNKILNNIYIAINNKNNVEFTRDVLYDKSNFTILKSELLKII